MEQKNGVSKCISDKIELKSKAVTRDTYHGIISINPTYMQPIQEQINIQILDIKRETNSNIVILGDFNTLLTSMDRSSKQKINKAIATLHNTLDQMDLIDVYGIFNPRKQQDIHSP